MAMNLPENPTMLLSMINMKLRDDGYATFEELCRAQDLDAEDIKARLSDAGYEYIPAPVNQFR